MRTPTKEELEEMLDRYNKIVSGVVEPVSPFEELITYKFLLQYDMI